MKKRYIFLGIMLGWMTVGTGCAQPTSSELMAMANEAIAEGESRTAEIHLRNLLGDEPDSAAARALLGQVLLNQGNVTSAEAALRRALELGAEPTAIQIPLLQAMLAQGRFAEVLAQIENGPQLVAENRVTVLRLAGAAHRGLNQPEQAEAAFRSALDLDPDSLEVRTDLASLMLSGNRVDDARRWIVEVLTEASTYSPALVLRGMLEFMGRRLDDAEATFLEIVEREGRTGGSYFAAMAPLVEVLLTQGDLEAASVQADALITAYPNHPTAIVLQAEVEVRQGELDAAKQRLEALVANAPQYAPASRILGLVNARQGQTRQAQMYLQSALAQSPQDRPALLYLAKLYLDLGDSAAATELLRRSLVPEQDVSDALLFALAARTAVQVREDTLAVQFVERGVEASSGDPQELLALAAAYAESGEMARAQALLQGASESDLGTAWVTSFGLALTQLQERDFDAADETAQRLSAMQPESPLPLNLRGMIAISRQDSTSAMEYFSSALRIDPRHVPALLNRSRVHMAEGRREQGIQDLRSVLDIQPDNAQALLTLTDLAIRNGDLDQARRLLEGAADSITKMRLQAALAAAEGRLEDAADIMRNVFDRQPTTESALQAFAAAQRAGRADPQAVLLSWVAEHPNDTRVNFVLGVLALQTGTDDEAIARFEAVVETNAEQAEALNNLAWLYGQRGDDRAVEIAERAHAVAPDNPAIADTLGWLYVRNGEADKGRPLLEQSHSAVPQNADIHFHWAVALAETGESSRAAEVLQDLLSTHADFTSREEAERLLRDLE